MCLFSVYYELQDGVNEDRNLLQYTVMI